VSALVANEGYITQPNKFIQCHGCRGESFARSPSTYW